MNEFQKYCKDRSVAIIFLPAVVQGYLVVDLNLRHPSQFTLKLLHVEVRQVELYLLQNQ